MDLFTLLAITAGILLVLLIVLILVAALTPRRVHEHDSDDLQQIKDQIEHEGEMEAEEELMPYKPPRLDKPTKKRL